MTSGALRLFLALALQLRCVTPLAIQQDRGTVGRQEGLDVTKTVSEKLNALFHAKDLPRGPAVAPHKKAPQFMLDLFNEVSVSDRTPKSQKEILDGNIVRSFEDKGEQNYPTHIYAQAAVFCENVFWKNLLTWLNSSLLKASGGDIFTVTIQIRMRKSYPSLQLRTITHSCGSVKRLTVKILKLFTKN